MTQGLANIWLGDCCTSPGKDWILAVQVVCLLCWIDSLPEQTGWSLREGGNRIWTAEWVLIQCPAPAAVSPTLMSQERGQEHPFVPVTYYHTMEQQLFLISVCYQGFQCLQIWEHPWATPWWGRATAMGRGCGRAGGQCYFPFGKFFSF